MEKTIEKCQAWENKLIANGYTKHLHPSVRENQGWYLLVKPGYKSYSILWDEALVEARKSYADTKYPIPEGCSAYWRMDNDLSKLCGVTRPEAQDDPTPAKPSRKPRP